MTKVGFIGLGSMGVGMARNIAAKGWPLSVWNRSPSKAESFAGANVAAVKTPAAAADGRSYLHEHG